MNAAAIPWVLARMLLRLIGAAAVRELVIGLGGAGLDGAAGVNGVDGRTVAGVVEDNLVWHTPQPRHAVPRS